MATLLFTHKTIERATARNGKTVELWHKGDIKLGVRVSPSGEKTFFVMPRINGKRVRVALGKFGDLSLAGAFDKARDAIKAAKAGTDLRAAASKPSIEDTLLFENVVARFLAKKVIDTRSYEETKRHFDRYAIPTFGGRSINEIRRFDVANLLDQIEEGRFETTDGKKLGGPVMADRVLSSFRRLFNWHATRDDRFASPLVKGMNRTSPAERRRKRVLNDREIRALWTATSDFPGYGDFVRTLFLTAQRRDEVLFMARTEFEADDIWLIPEERYKTGRTNRVPLTERVLSIIGAQPIIRTERGDSPLVFTLNGKNPVSNLGHQKAALDKKMTAALGPDTKMEHWTLHDLRRTAKTLMSRAGVRPDISERVLGHVLQGIEGTYDRHDYLDEKRRALEALDELVTRILENTNATIIPLRKT